MKFDFTSVFPRQDAIAVERIPIPGAEVKEGFSKIPMWVADMNFKSCPTISEAIIERAKHETYGYFSPADAYFDSIIRWQKERNGVKGLKREDIGYENGVLGGVASAVNAFTQPGEAILLHSPTYVGFTGTLQTNGRKIVLSDLYRDEEGIWRMDYEDMDRKIKENHIHFAVFCSPHNPTGRVWTKEEIEKAMEVYKKNDVTVVSDEIWSDILLNGHKHVPTQSVSKDAKNRTIAMYAPSKTFNLAGLIGSYHIIYNPALRDAVNNAAAQSHYNSMNVLSMHALIGAYKKEGQEWVDELDTVLSDNVNYAYDYIKKHFKGVDLAKPEGTYLLYLDCSKWCAKHHTDIDTLLKKGVEAGVIWQDGRGFHLPDSIRMNLAVPTALVKEAMKRLDKYVFNAK